MCLLLYVSLIFKVIAFLPDHLLDFAQIGHKKRTQALDIKQYRPSQLPDNVTLLNEMANKEVINLFIFEFGVLMRVLGMEWGCPVKWSLTY